VPTGNELVLINGGGAVIVMFAMAVLAASATLDAETVILVSADTVGACRSPDEEILPVLADHVTEVCVVPLTVAVNCNEPPDSTLAVAGEMLVTT